MRSVNEDEWVWSGKLNFGERREREENGKLIIVEEVGEPSNKNVRQEARLAMVCLNRTEIQEGSGLQSPYGV